MRLIPSKWAAALVAVVVVVSTGAATEKNTPYPRRSPIVDAVQKTKASIVTVKVPRPSGGKDLIGTGVIIDERGFIVTNRHVVGASRHVKVRLHDGADVAAQMVWGDPAYDLAVLRIDAGKKLQALELAPV